MATATQTHTDTQRRRLTLSVAILTQAILAQVSQPFLLIRAFRLGAVGFLHEHKGGALSGRGMGGHGPAMQPWRHNKTSAAAAGSSTWNQNKTTTWPKSQATWTCSGPHSCGHAGNPAHHSKCNKCGQPWSYNARSKNGWPWKQPQRPARAANPAAQAPRVNNGSKWFHYDKDTGANDGSIQTPAKGSEGSPQAGQPKTKEHLGHITVILGSDHPTVAEYAKQLEEQTQQSPDDGKKTQEAYNSLVRALHAEHPTVVQYKTELEEQQKQERLHASSQLSPQRQYENKQRYIEQHKEKILKAQGRVKSHEEQRADIEIKIKDDQQKIAEWSTKMEEAEKERDELWKLTNPAPGAPERERVDMDDEPNEKPADKLSFSELLAQLKDHAQAEMQAGNEKLAPLLQSINRELFVADSEAKQGAPSEGQEGAPSFGPQRTKQGERVQPYDAGASTGTNDTDLAKG